MNSNWLNWVRQLEYFQWMKIVSDWLFKNGAYKRGMLEDFNNNFKGSTLWANFWKQFVVLEFLWIVFLNSFFEFWWKFIKAFRTKWFHIEFNELFLQIKFLLTSMTFEMKITISFFQGTYYFILKGFRVIRDTNSNKYLPYKMTTTTIKIHNYPQVAWFRVRIYLYNKITDNTDITVQLIVMSFTIWHIVGTKEILNLKDFRTLHFRISKNL